MCGSTCYRRVVARDERGALRATDMFQCSGCSLVFADLKAWRDDETGKDSRIEPVRHGNPFVANRP